MAELYKCGSPYTMKPAGNVQLLPGAYSVKPIAFSEIENNDCKILTTHVVEKKHHQIVWKLSLQTKPIC